MFGFKPTEVIGNMIERMKERREDLAEEEDEAEEKSNKEWKKIVNLTLWQMTLNI